MRVPHCLLLETILTVLVFTFGALMCIILIVAFVYYFSPNRKNEVESPKYKMLEDEEKN
jgi:cbb3-type cytochrome oxidase subunit 3